MYAYTPLINMGVTTCLHPNLNQVKLTFVSEKKTPGANGELQCRWRPLDLDIYPCAFGDKKPK